MFTQEEFEIKAREFLDLTKARRSCDSWELCETSNGSYLKTRQIYEHANNETILVELHVLHHKSFGVPIIFFKPSHSDGSVMRLEEVYEFFKTEDSQNLISQAEHPLLFRPFYTFHPCKVADVLMNLKETENFIATFLTIYCPLIGLKCEISD